MKSMQVHESAILATKMEGKWLFTGGLDGTIKIQVHVLIIVFFRNIKVDSMQHN